MLIGDILRLHPTIDLDSTLNNAVEKISAGDVDLLIVLNEGKPIGVLSSYDIIKGISKDNQHPTISNMMNQNLIIFDVKENVTQALATLLEHGQWLAAVVEKGFYKGIVTPRCFVSIKCLSPDV